MSAPAIATAAPAAPAVPPLGGSIAAGVRWNILDQVVQQALRIAVSVALARLLLPREFGVAALAFIVSDLAKYFGDVGVATGLVFVKRLRPAHARTAITAGLVTGLAMTGAVMVAASPLASFFHQAEVRPVLMVMSTIFVLKGLVAPVQSLWRRDLVFRPFVISNSIAVGIAGPAAIVAAVAGAGVWALVIYGLGEAVVGTVACYAIALPQRRHSLLPGFQWSAFRELLAFGASVSGTRVVLYGRQNLDNVVVGRALGAAPLGFYDFAYNLMLYPIQRLSSVVSAVSFPAFSRLRDEQQRLAAAYTRALSAICLVAFPVTVASSVAAPLYVPVVFGDRWRPAVLTVQVLALNGVRLSMTTLNGTVMESTGKPAWNLMLNLGLLAVAFPGFVIGVHFGIIGVAVAYTVAGCAALPVSMVLAGRRLRLPLRGQAVAFRVAAIASVSMAGAIEATMLALRGHLQRPAVLAVVLVAGAGVYLVVLVRLDPTSLRDAMTSISRRADPARRSRMPAPESPTQAQPDQPIVEMARASAAQWDLLAAAQSRASTAEQVLALLHLADTRRDGFAVTQLTHCLQTATRAERAGADSEVVVAALCHDIGKAIPHADHGAVAASILRPHVRAEVAEVIRTHAAFQRRYTHHYLGGSADESRRYRRRSWYPLAQRFCEWDQASFDPSYDTLPLVHFEPRLRRVLGATVPARGGTGIRTAIRRARAATARALGIG